ncbi:MAG TPA: hypothetical protein PKX56_01545, partial [Marmoricola sp.]|nr:hypothetical protein [Marmoricola sp.]
MARLRFGKRTRSRSSHLVVLLVVVAGVLVILDSISVTRPALQPLRVVSDGLLGSTELVVHGATAPIRRLGEYADTNAKLRGDVARLSNQNSELRSQAELAGLDRARLADLEGLTRLSNQTEYQLIPARVVAMGPLQSFSRT